MKGRAPLLAVALVSLATPSRAEDPAELIKAILGAVTGWAGILRDQIEGRLLKEQVEQQETIRHVVVEVAFPPPPDELTQRGGVFRPIPLLLPELRSLGTETKELRGDWRFSARTQPIHAQRAGEASLGRAQVEALFGPAGNQAMPARERLLQLVSGVSENVIGSHSVAAGEWASVLPTIEAQSALGARRTPGEALRDAAWLTADAGRVAQANSDLLAQRLFMETLDAGVSANEERLVGAVALSSYTGLACLDGACGRRKR